MEKAGVVTLMTRGEDQIYLSRRINCRGFNGLLQGGGGRIEDGETVKQAARRELKEEADLDIWEERIHHVGTDREQLNSAGEKFTLEVCRVELMEGEVPKNAEPDLHGEWELHSLSAMRTMDDLMPGLKSFTVQNELVPEWGRSLLVQCIPAAQLLVQLYELYAPISALIKPQDQWDEMDILEYQMLSKVRRMVRQLPKSWQWRRGDGPQDQG